MTVLVSKKDLVIFLLLLVWKSTKAVHEVKIMSVTNAIKRNGMFYT